MPESMHASRADVKHYLWLRPVTGSARLYRMTSTKPRMALKLARVGLDLSQWDLAVRLNMSVWRLHKIERGQIDPTPEERKLLAKVLKIGADAL